MKKTFLLIVACVFAFATVQAQSSEVEATTQLTKAEEFKLNCSFIKETEIYKYEGLGLQILTKLFTDLKSNEQLVALEFCKLFSGIPISLGYLDMDQADDLLFALENMLNMSSNSAKTDKFTISYTAPGGLDVYYDTNYPGYKVPMVILRKKRYKLDEYGVQTYIYSETSVMLSIEGLPKLISAIKEAQLIANQALAK